MGRKETKGIGRGGVKGKRELMKDKEDKEVTRKRSGEVKNSAINTVRPAPRHDWKKVVLMK